MSFLIFLTVISAVLTRLPLFGMNPPGMGHDELEYINNAYSILKTGNDLYGSTFPLTIGGVGYVAFPAYLISPFLIFGLNSFTARLLPGVLGLFNLLFIYLISLKLFNKESALYSLIIATFSFWGIITSRIAFDPPIALFFYLTSITIATYSKNFKGLVLSFLLLSLGFLSYYGALFTYPPLLVVLAIYNIKVIKNKKQVFFLVLIFVMTLIIYYLMLFGPSDNTHSFKRSSETLLFQREIIEKQVNHLIFHSDGPVLVSRIFINKISVFLNFFLNNYLEAFSLKMIFLNGDQMRHFSLWDRGNLPLYSLPLLLIGIIKSFHNKRPFIFLIILLLISPLSSGMSSQTFTFRSFLLFPILIIFSGFGMFQLQKQLQKQKLISRFFLLALLSIIFMYSTTALLHQYFIRYPIYASEIWFESEKELSLKLKKEAIDNPITIYSPESRQVFMQYLFFNGFSPSEVQKALKASPTREEIKYQNITFKNYCPSQNQIDLPAYVFHTCPKHTINTDHSIKAKNRSNEEIWFKYQIENND